MALWPEKQRIAQAEIDRVIGAERLPLIQDRPHLPYVNALIKEVLRWRPVLPLGMSLLLFPSDCNSYSRTSGLARATTEDDVYQGYLIPKSTVIIPNVWCVSL